MTYLLDTDICVYWLRGREPLRSRLAALDLTQLSISAITLCELRYGADASSRPDLNHISVDEFAASVSAWGVDARIARAFGEVKAQLRRSGQLIEDFDLLIAATALANDLTLVTNNLAHFSRIDGLRLENWVAD